MVIARFSWLKAGLLLVLLFLMLAGGYDVMSEGMRSAGFWLFAVCTPLIAMYALAILRELVFHRARSVWIENGKLVFVPYGWPAGFTSYLYRIPVDNIARFSIGRMYTGNFLRPNGIFVETKSEQSFELPTHLLRDDGDVVMARLNEALGLPAAAQSNI